MRYFKIPIIDGNPDIADTDNFDLLFYIGDGKTVYGIMVDGVVRDSWLEITEEDFDKFTIGAQEEVQETPKQTISEQLESIQKEIQELRQTQEYLIGLQSGAYDDAMTPVEDETVNEATE